MCGVDRVRPKRCLQLRDAYLPLDFQFAYPFQHFLLYKLRRLEQHSGLCRGSDRCTSISSSPPHHLLQLLVMHCVPFISPSPCFFIFHELWLLYLLRCRYRLECAPQHSTAVAVASAELKHPPDNVEETTAHSNYQPPSAVKCVAASSFGGGLYRLFRAEISKACHLQIDCGLNGRDWRLVYAGSSLVGFGPCALLLLRGAVFVGHLAALVFVKIYRDILFFTTWTNLVALAGYLLSTIISIAAVCSLSRQTQAAEAGGDASGSSASAAPRGSCLSFFKRVDLEYKQLLKLKTELTCCSPQSPSKTQQQPLEGCCDFRRPFSGGPNRPALEALLCLHDVVFCLALPMVTVMLLVYWTLLFPMHRPNHLWASVYVHLCCPLATWGLSLLSRVPYRLCMLPFCFLLGACYAVMIATMQSFGFGFVYWFLNFLERPAVACGMTACFLLVLNPAAACLCFLALYRNTSAVIAAHP